jgi:formylglycine-generating enzyme required for sulfatase activity
MPIKSSTRVLFILLFTAGLVASCTPSVTATPGQAVTVIYITFTPEPTVPSTPTSEFRQSAPPECTEIGQTWTSPADGMTLLCVPAGEFAMGAAAADEFAAEDENPQHTVYLDAYWVDQTEVTNAMYARCVQAGYCQPPGDMVSSTRKTYYGDAEYAGYPALFISWHGAQTYCQWANRRLLTEAEWEKAARGTDARIYPWGDGVDCTLANTLDCVGDTDQAGARLSGASPYGALDMAGNIWEWTADYYAEDYYKSSPAQNPAGPATGDGRVLRGGSWDLEARFSRTTQRMLFPPAVTGVVFGIRCGY